MTRQSSPSSDNNNLAEGVGEGIRHFSTDQAGIGCATILATVGTFVGLFFAGLQIGANTSPLPQTLPLEQTVHAVQTVTSAVGTAIALEIIVVPSPQRFGFYGTATAIIQEATQQAQTRAEALENSSTPNIEETIQILEIQSLEDFQDISFGTATRIIVDATLSALPPEQQFTVEWATIEAELKIAIPAQATVQAALQTETTSARFMQAAATATARANLQIEATGWVETAIAEAVETFQFQLTANLPTYMPNLPSVIPSPTNIPSLIDDFDLTATSFIQTATALAETLFTETQPQPEQAGQSTWLSLFLFAGAVVSLMGIFILSIRNRRG